MLPPIKCLLVDDLEDNLLALSALLERDDVELLTARSGSEALELLLEHDFALAFLDVQMPDMDGFELAELIRGSDRTRHVPLIFVTAGARERQRVFKGYESGAVDFIYKPIEAHILQNKADVFFQLYRQRQQIAHELQERTETLRCSRMILEIH
jgi:two-component system sensor histidine kinase/response regulator